MYKHTFYLVNEQKIVTYSDKADMPNYRYGDMVVFESKNSGVKYTIPVMNILYVETEELENRDEYLCKEQDWVEEAWNWFIKNIHGNGGNNGK